MKVLPKCTKSESVDERVTSHRIASRRSRRNKSESKECRGGGGRGKPAVMSAVRYKYIFGWPWPSFVFGSLGHSVHFALRATVRPRHASSEGKRFDKKKTGWSRLLRLYFSHATVGPGQARLYAPCVTFPTPIAFGKRNETQRNRKTGIFSSLFSSLYGSPNSFYTSHGLSPCIHFLHIFRQFGRN